MRLRKTLKWEWYLSAPIIFLLALSSFAQSTVNNTYQDEEDIDARVARVSFLRGDVRIKRGGEGEAWESARTNLPIVEGDRIETERDSALEIQFDTYKYLRIAGNSAVKITTLRDEGIALSISEGTLSLRVNFIDKDRNFFEIDAPQTTVSIQKEGSYRIDAGNNNSDSIRVSATDGGQARIYSQDSGFSIRSGRSARIYIAGNMSGEWETSDAGRFADEWDSFVADRDKRVNKSLNDAQYGKYYERDIYGAEDLNDYGEWIDSPDYGKVWRPYQRSTSQYANWSPYRYGSWQWVSPYGWTWVNDEPWGWATYHYGRWVSYRNTWVWCPYSRNRGRNRWRPALVAITYINRDIYWYPLCYHQDYYDYNSYYRRHRNDHRDHDRRDRRNDRDDHRDHNRGGWENQHASRNVPNSGVVSMPGDDFGRRRGRTRPADSIIARKVLEDDPRFEDDSFRPERRREDRTDGNRENERRDRDAWRVRTGAADRRAGVPMEREINDTRVFDNRRRRERTQDQPDPNVPGSNEGNSGRRDTGAVERPNRRRDGENRNDPGAERERREPNESDSGRENVPKPTVRRETLPEDSGRDGAERERRREERQRGDRRDSSQPPVTTPPFNPNPPERRVETRREEPKREEPIIDAPRENPRPPRKVNPDDEPRREERRPEPRREESRREEPRQEERRTEPPRAESRREEPRQEAPRREEPRREEPRQEPKREEPRREERRQETRKEEPKREEPRREQPRKESPEVEKAEPPDNLMAALEGFFSGLFTFAGISGD